MPWTRTKTESRGCSQVGLIHIYKNAAHLSQGEYRSLLKTHTVCGAFSSTDSRLTQHDFDTVMPILEQKVEAYHRAHPDAPLPRKIDKLTYWRQRQPKNGAMNSRQRHKIFALWDQLKPHLSDDQRNIPYLTSIAAKSSAHWVSSIWDCTAWQANLLIEALKDRLRARAHDTHAAGETQGRTRRPLPQE